MRRYKIDPVTNATIPLVELGSGKIVPESCNHDKMANIIPNPDNNSQSSL